MVAAFGQLMGAPIKKALVPEKIGAYCDTKKLARID